MALRENPEQKKLESEKWDNPERNNLECNNPETNIIELLNLNRGLNEIMPNEEH